MTAIYEIIERCIEVHSTLTTEQYERCLTLTHAGPARHKSFAGLYYFPCADEGDQLALQDYVIEQRLPHAITITREWKP